jgi:hypothetical protein
MNKKDIIKAAFTGVAGAFYGFLSFWTVLVGYAMAADIFSDDIGKEGEYTFLIPFGILILFFWGSVSVILTIGLKNWVTRVIFWIMAIAAAGIVYVFNM